MFRRAFVVHVLIALACQVHGDCIKSFRAVNNLKEVTSKEPLDWLSINNECRFGTPQATLIRSVHDLSASERKLCKGGLVPLGIEKINGHEFNYGGNWADATPLAEGDNGYQDYDFELHYGVLDLTSGSIRFTGETMNFTCALCRYDDVPTLDEIEFSSNYGANEWEKEFFAHYNARLTSSGKNKQLMHPTDKDIKNLADKIVVKLKSFKDYSGKSSVKDVVFKSSKLGADGSMELDFHFFVDTLKAENLDMDPFQNIHLDANYQMSVVENMDCAEELLTEENGSVSLWTSTSVGSKQHKVNLTTWIVTIRSCKFDDVTDMPAWTAPLVWKIIHEPCSEYDEYVSNITNTDILGPSIEFNQQHQLQQFTESPADAKTLAEVARLTSREIRAAKELTTEMHDDLRKILAALQTNGKPVVVQEPRVNFVVADLGKKSQAVNGFTMTFKETGLGQIVEPISLAVHRKASSNQVDPPPTVSLTVSDDIVGVANKIAFAAFWKPMDSWEDDTTLGQYLEVDVILAGLKVGLFSDKSFIDIAYQLNDASGATNVSCRALTDGDDYMYMSEDYSMDYSIKGCKYIDSVTKTEILCRCETKYFPAKDGVFRGTFSLKETRPRPTSYYQSYKPYNDPSFNFSSGDNNYEY